MSRKRVVSGQGGWRPGAGAPRKIQEVATLQVKLERRTKELLQKWANRFGMKMSEVARDVLEKWIDKQERKDKDI